MKNNILVVCLLIGLCGCQQAPQQSSSAGPDKKEASQKLLEQSILMLQQKDLKGAITELEAAIQADPSNPEPSLIMAQILLKSGEFDKAADFMDITAKNFPDNGMAFYMLSVSCKMAGRKLPAVLSARRSFEIFNAAGDKENAAKSAILLQQVIADAQATEVAVAPPAVKGALPVMPIKK